MQCFLFDLLNCYYFVFCFWQWTIESCKFQILLKKKKKKGKKKKKKKKEQNKTNVIF